LAVPAGDGPVSPLSQAGFALLLLYLFSFYALINEMFYAAAGFIPHTTKVFGVLTLLCALAGGTLLRGFQSRIAVLWALFILWNVAAIPFSQWRGGSTQVVLGVLPAHALAFLIPALATTLARVRKTIYCLAVTMALVFVYCVTLGVMKDGRLIISRSIFGNPNDLALHLLLGMAIFLVFFRPKSVLVIIGLLGMAALGACIVRTGSRGTFVSALAVAGVWLLFGTMRVRVTIIAGGLLLAVLAVFVAPKSTIERLTMIELNADEAMKEAKTGDEGKSIASQLSREELFIKSVRYTLEHPIFGVGPGEFVDALMKEAGEEGKHVQALRPHNAYTQISAEAGIPALVLYLGAVLLALAANYRVYKAVRGVNGLEAVAAQSMALLTLTLAHGFNALFVHVSGFSYEGLIVGLSIANYLAAARELPELRAKFMPARELSRLAGVRG
jgi:O-antigen ligase